MQIRWNVFKGRQFQSRAARHHPRVTLDKNGVFYLNEKAWLVMDSPQSVELSSDDSGRIFGMKGCDPTQENAFQLRERSGKNHCIAAAAFFQNLRMHLDRTVLFQNVDLDNSGVLILDMNTSVTIRRGAR